jgi:hypothetical protein
VGARDFLPWRNFAIETSWSPEVAALELQKRIGARGLGGAREPGGAPFAGEALGDMSFRFTRVIAYRNSFLPVIRATVRPSSAPGAHARIHVTMRLHQFVMAFGFVWMSGALLGGLSAGLVAVRSGNLGGLVALGFPLFGAVLFTVPFAIEARIAERLLREVYAAAPPTGPYR